MSGPRRLQAPSCHGAVLAEPAISEVNVLLDRNKQTQDHGARALLGRPWSDLCRRARQELVAAAVDYLRQAGEPIPSAMSASTTTEHAAVETILLTGHQPELFHPGVWIKNFVLNGLARTYGAAALNLVIDSDTARDTALKVPGCDQREPRGLASAACDPSAVRRLTVPFDRWVHEVPYEERRVADEALFASLPERLAPFLRDWSAHPLLPDYWAEVLSQAQRTPLLGERLSAARRAVERRWGCHNLEVPIGLVCQTEAFAWFSCQLLSQLPRFHAVYNACVHDYRRRHGIKSRFHPVPDLAVEGDWLEVPFWAWRSDRPWTGRRRRRIMARLERETLQLKIAGEPAAVLTLGALSNPNALVRAWQELERHGIKVRGRALMTTLYARLFLCDLFIHGIGGAKYDELTDEIVRRFHGIEPPGYLVLSATLLLSLPPYPARPEECARRAWQLHDLYSNPQRHLAGSDSADAQALPLAAEKQAWIARAPASAAERHDRHRALRTLTRQLREHAAGRIERGRQDLERCRRELKANAVLQRRDYAFCLFSEEALRGFYKSFLC